MGKNQAQNGSKQQANATTLCEELHASNCMYKSRGAPAKGIRATHSTTGENGWSTLLRGKLCLNYI